jgi:hypothetical protein
LGEKRVNAKPNDVLGNSFNFNVTDHRAVKFVEYQDLQEHVADIGV